MGKRVEVSIEISHCVALLDSQSGALTSVSTEKQPPQIRDLAAHERKQFRVRATALGKRSWPGADQVAHCLIHGTIFVGRGHNAGGINPIVTW